MSSVEFERYRQIQVSAYHDGGSQTLPDGTVARPVELGIVNRNTMQERTARYTEQWRYDEAAKTWWNTAGLPDLWSGQ